MMRVTIGKTLRPAAYAALSLLIGAGSASAQAQVWTQSALVTQIAGDEVYLSVAETSGLSVEDQISAFDEQTGEHLGQLRVGGLASTRIVASFVDAPFPLTRGTTIQLQWNGGGSVDSLPVAGPASAAAATPTSRQPSSRSPRVSGRLTLEVAAMNSRTEWEDYDISPVERRFATPAVGLWLQATDLPWDLRFSARLRGSYRASTDDRVQPQNLLRLYSLDLEKRFGKADFRLGRFYNPYQALSGYFDGLYGHYGGEGLGAGFAAGFEPDRANSTPSTDIPKFMGFVNFRDSRGPVRYDGALSVNRLEPGSDTPGLTFVGLSQALRIRRVSLTQSLVVDRYSGASGWTVSQFLLGASAPLGGGFRLRAQYNLRQPGRLAAPDSIVTYRRDRLRAGLTWSFGRGTVGADVAANDVDDDATSYTLGGFVNFPRTDLWQLGIGLSGSYWTRDSGNVIRIAPALNRAFGRVLTRAWYSYYRSEELVADLTSHTIGASVDFPLSRSVSGWVRATTRFGGPLAANSVYTGVRIGF